MTYMGIIEQRINEILKANAYITQSKQFDDAEDNNLVKFEQVNFSGFLPKPNVGSVPLVGNISKKNSPSHGAQQHHFSHLSPEHGRTINDDNSDDSDEDDEKPMGIEEFKARVMGIK